MTDLYQRLRRFQSNTTSGAAGAGASSQSAQPVSHASQTSSSSTAMEPNLLDIPSVMRGSDLARAVEKREETKQDFIKSLGLEIVENRVGAYAYQEICYPKATLPYSADDLDGPEMLRLTGDETFAALTAYELLFIDTETTGLAGGTGTLPFLIGGGFFTEQGFVVQQYFMRDYDDEPAALEALRTLIQRFRAVASYNGKRFDLPLLQSRLLLNRMRIDLTSRPHFDLLYPARRFWREVLPNCRLGTVEAHVFQHTRPEDIPGELIPYVYFDFLRGIRMERIRPVLAHNAEDIRTLAMLAAKTCRMLRHPQRECEHPLELLAVGRCLTTENDWQQAGELMEHALTSGNLPQEQAESVWRQVSLMYKRAGYWQKAVSLWLQMLTFTEDNFAHIELAKYYEHKVKRFDQALTLTEQAIHLCHTPEQSHALHHRRQRLLKKAGSREIV